MKLKISTAMYIIPFIVLLFQQALIKNTTGLFQNLVSYFDEIYCLILAGCFIKNQIFKKIKKNRNDYYLFWYMIVFFLIGILSSIVCGYISIGWSFIDAFICSKFLIVYFAIKYGEERSIKFSTLSRISKLCIFLFFVLTIVNYVIPIFPKGEYRFFMNSVSLFFGHPTFYAAAVITCVSIVIASESYSNKKSKNDFFIYLGLFCVMTSLRMKAIAAALGIFFLYLYFVKFKLKNKKIAFVMAGCIFFLVGLDQLKFYYGDSYLYDDNFVRARMLVDSIKIANMKFPFGSGFGTFASDVAKKAATPLYTIYGYKLDSPYLSDTFWPIIIAQCGWLGFLAFGAMLLKFLKNIFAMAKTDKNIFCSSCSIVLYLLICTLGESAFFHPICIPMFIVVGINCRNLRIREMKETTQK